jgi:hypothetical protein
MRYATCGQVWRLCPLYYMLKQYQDALIRIASYEYTFYCVLFFRPDNYLLLSHVLERVGLTHAEFITAHRDEVVVYEVNHRALQSHSGPIADKDEHSEAATADCQRVELVRMCDVIRRLLNIDVIPVSGQCC